MNTGISDAINLAWKLFAMSIISPMIFGLLFHEVFGAESPSAPDLDALAAQHSEAILQGILVR